MSAAQVGDRGSLLVAAEAQSVSSNSMSLSTSGSATSNLGSGISQCCDQVHSSELIPLLGLVNHSPTTALDSLLVTLDSASEPCVLSDQAHVFHPVVSDYSCIEGGPVIVGHSSELPQPSCLGGSIVTACSLPVLQEGEIASPILNLVTSRNLSSIDQHSLLSHSTPVHAIAPGVAAVQLTPARPSSPISSPALSSFLGRPGSFLVHTPQNTGEASKEFLGFSSSPPFPNKAATLRALKSRKSLSPIKAILSDCRADLEEFRRRSRARQLSRYRNLDLLPSSEVNGAPSDDASCSLIGPSTRSRTTVPDMIHVLHRPLEYRPRRLP